MQPVARCRRRATRGRTASLSGSGNSSIHVPSSTSLSDAHRRTSKPALGLAGATRCVLRRRRLTATATSTAATRGATFSSRFGARQCLRVCPCFPQVTQRTARRRGQTVRPRESRMECSFHSGSPALRHQEHPLALEAERRTEDIIDRCLLNFLRNLKTYHRIDSKKEINFGS